MQHVSVKLQKLNENAIVPKYGTRFSAGADLYSCEGKAVTVEPHQTVFIHTGIAIEIPDGLVGLVYARSGLASKRSLAPANKVGVIDCDYRGEIIVSLHNHSDEPQTIEDKERVAQLVLTPCFRPNLTAAEVKALILDNVDKVDALSDTERGQGGFGSTGKL